ncbi:heme exporter protein CcmB [Bacteroidota bacterium]
MSKANIIRIKAVFLKDLKSEFRTRYGISAISLFILTSITMLVFSTGQEKMTAALHSGLLWVIMFFSSMTGLSKGFVREEERQTSLLLKIASRPGAIYFGKLFYNILFSITLNLLAVILFLLFFGSIAIEAPFAFVIIILLGSLGIGSATTIISAIISKAGIKNSLFTVLSFPILLPLIMVVIEGTTMSFEGVEISQLTNSFQILLAYSGVLIPVSYIVFDMIWED